MRTMLATALMCCGVCFGLSGCMAYDVASTAVHVTTTVVGTGIDAAGSVVGAAAGSVSGGAPPAKRSGN